MKIGVGYDIHRFAKNRKLILGGVEIKYKFGLEGHSDADVLVHAIMDSLLGAAGLGDIGQLFPNNDPQYKNISSIKLLEKVGKILAREKLKVVNIDTVIIAEEPKIMKFAQSMKDKISKALEINSSQINIKATTNEKLGEIGAKKGIACFAVCLLK